MKMTSSRKVILPAISMAVGALCASPVQAQQAAQENVIILLDQTGTMCSDQSPCFPKTGSFWLNAIDDAISWVNADSLNDVTHITREYAIWTFKNTMDGVQNGAVQLWPTSTFNTNCSGAWASIDTKTGFCKLSTANTRGYDAVTATLGAIKTMVGQVPDPMWWTPLADSLCRATSSLWSSLSGQSKTLIL